MKELEYSKKKTTTKSKAKPSPIHPPKADQLSFMTTDELVKLLTGPQTARSINTKLREQIIKTLQKREGNAFVEKILKENQAQTSK